MKRNIEDNYLIDQLRDENFIYIAIWKEDEIYKLYVNDIVVVESADSRHKIQIEGNRIKNFLYKHLRVKIKTNLH